MNDSYFLEMVAKQKQIEFEQQARLRRLRRTARGQQPGVWAKMWIRFGDFLIHQGEAMKSRYMHQPCLAPCTSKAGGRLHRDT